MRIDAIDALLDETLADFRVSRGERREIQRRLERLGADPGRIGLWRSRAFEAARRAVRRGADWAETLDWLEAVIKVVSYQNVLLNEESLSSAAYFAPEDECPKAIAGLFHRVKEAVDVCVFTITDDRITEAILAAHERGARLRIITDDLKAEDLGSDIARLRRAGVALRTDRDENHMHHKFAIFDDRTLLTGSYNWTRGASDHNFENFVTTDDPRLVAAFSKHFNRLWERLS